MASRRAVERGSAELVAREVPHRPAWRSVLRAAVPGSADHPACNATRRPTNRSTTAGAFRADPHGSAIVHLRAYPDTWGGRRRGQYAARGRNSRKRPLPRAVSAVATPIGPM